MCCTAEVWSDSRLIMPLAMAHQNMNEDERKLVPTSEKF